MVDLVLFIVGNKMIIIIIIINSFKALEQVHMGVLVFIILWGSNLELIFRHMGMCFVIITKMVGVVVMASCKRDFFK